MRRRETLSCNFGSPFNPRLKNFSKKSWWNITLLQTDCFVDLNVNLANTTDGWNSWGSYHFDLTGPCDSLFDLMEQDGNGSWQLVGDSLGTGTNEMQWDLSNLEPGMDYHFDWTVISQTFYDQHSDAISLPPARPGNQVQLLINGEAAFKYFQAQLKTVK